MESPQRQILRPTCARCRMRKVRCDGQMPRCGPCEQADVDCLIAGVSSSSPYNRSYVESLQERVRELQRQEQEVEALLESKRKEGGRPMAAEDLSASNHGMRNGWPDASPIEIGASNNEHGMGFIDLIFAKIKTEVAKSSGTLSWPPSYNRNTTASTMSNSSPRLSPTMVDSLFETYTRRSLSRYPYIELHVVEGLRIKVLQTIASPEAGISPEESFRAYAIMATGAVYRNQELCVQNIENNEEGLVSPNDLFAIAMQDIVQVNLLHGITGVQNLLLITRYRLFQAIGASLWDLTFLCLRACVACSFHLRPMQHIPACEEQMQRRVFWQCYGVDRYVSTTLGRPFGIADDDITVALPANLDDVELKAAQAVLPYASLDDLVRSRNPSNALTEMSLAISHFQLRQISSRAFRDLGALRRVVTKQNPPSVTDSGPKSMTIKTEVWKLYYQHLEELLDWKSRSRRYQQDRVGSTSNDNSFLNDARWIDLHFHQEQLFLICLSMKSTPATSDFIEPLDLIDELYDAGSNVITLYSKLAGDAKVEPTAGRLYRVLTAGFSILYTIIVKFHTRADGITRQNGISSLHDELSPRGRLVECKAMLRLCTRTMSRMAEQVTSQQLTPKYVGYFNLLCREVLRVVSGEGEVSSGRQLAATSTDGSGAAQLISSETYLPEISPGCFSDDLITAQLTCQLPTEHLQPCYCAIFEDRQAQPAGSVPVTWLNPTHHGVGFDGNEYDLGSFVAEWNDSTVWEALFGDFQRQSDTNFIPM